MNPILIVLLIVFDIYEINNVSQSVFTRFVFLDKLLIRFVLLNLIESILSSHRTVNLASVKEIF
jgi:hypothetical protein